MISAVFVGTVFVGTVFVGAVFVGAAFAGEVLSIVNQPQLLGEESLFLGKDLLPWLMLAIGAALVVANLAAWLRPPRLDPADPTSPRREPAPLSRVAPLVVLGLIVSIWSLASLVQ